ncbi:MAG TPA: hypothetical protein PKL36_12830, partial [Agitococcus sp.]|nr:hypothetical protein [Agitococcus sp.]
MRTKNTELHTKSEEKSPVFGGGNYVISANSTNRQAANDPIKNESYPPLEDGQLKRKSEDKQSPENLGDVLKTEQTTAPNIRDTFTQIEEFKPYTQDELNKLLNQAAKPLYFHLIDCQQCSLEDTRYCSDGMTLGKRFDNLLLCFDDAADKRYKLMNQVI